MKIFPLLEFQYGTFGRPDSSGIRDHGVERPEYDRSEDYPYDMPMAYGQPTDYDKGGTTGVNPSFNGITPVNTNHSVWDDIEPIDDMDIEEILGSPILLSKNAQMGSATGVPGADGSWTTGKGSWNAQSMTDDELDAFGEQITKKEQEKDVLTKGDYPSDIMTFGSSDSFTQGLGKAYRSLRGSGGLIPKESVWKFFEE